MLHIKKNQTNWPFFWLFCLRDSVALAWLDIKTIVKFEFWKATLCKFVLYKRMENICLQLFILQLGLWMIFCENIYAFLGQNTRKMYLRVCDTYKQ